MTQHHTDPLLSCTDLSIIFNTHEGNFSAVHHLDFKIGHGEIVGLVGESGCGKSLTALSIMGLLPETASAQGRAIHFEGKNLLKINEPSYQQIRGNRISMIFQEPMTSLNPVFKVGYQVREALLLHQNIDKTKARIQAISMLKDVGIPAPEQAYTAYPHELSGGMRQRVMIAMAMCCNPKLLIADEPTTALDVTIQAQIIELIKGLVHTRNMSVLFITHDLGVVAEICDRVIVMYAGNILEAAGVENILEHPLHPYTQGLLKAIPQIDNPLDYLHIIPGSVPALKDLKRLTGCCFEPRCANAMDICRQTPPAVHTPRDNHQVRCHLYNC
jgi:oligopeptide/dipeptide ABC transporter ATP-binding protein